MNENTPVVVFVGLSGTGKTTFLEKLIPELKAHGLRLAVLKHDTHGFEMDKPGKDTYRMKAAGADSVTICSGGKLAIIETLPEEPSVADILAKLQPVFDPNGIILYNAVGPMTYEDLESYLP